MAPSNTPTPTFTLSTLSTFTQTPIPTAACASETVEIFDERGELVTTLCGTLGPLAPGPLDLTVSSLVPNASGPGGTLDFLLNGKIAASWDTTDKNGKPVVNGFYYLVFQQRFTDGTHIRMEKTFFVAPWGRASDVQLTAWPNIVHGGESVRLTAVIGANPADGGSRLKIYSINGELVKNLAPSVGQMTWDLSNNHGQAVAAGLYLLVLDGRDPASGNPMHKTIKVVVLR